METNRRGVVINARIERWSTSRWSVDADREGRRRRRRRRFYCAFAAAAVRVINTI